MYKPEGEHERCIGTFDGTEDEVRDMAAEVVVNYEWKRGAYDTGPTWGHYDVVPAVEQ